MPDERSGHKRDMPHDSSDQVGHGEASLGEAQSSNPPVDPEYLEDDAAPPEEPGDEDPAPDAA